MSRPESLLEYQTLALKAHQFFEPVFAEDRLLMFHSTPYRKKLYGKYIGPLKFNRSML